MRFTNNTGIPLAVAVWLVHDDYDKLEPAPNEISVTTLVKSVRQIILQKRMGKDPDAATDISELVASRMGQALHGSIEGTWLSQHQESLKKLGYPPGLIKSIRVNPQQQEVGTISVYLEQRNDREIMGWKVTGKFDMCIDGRLHDIKKTSVYAYQARKGVDDKWLQQCSLYRWLNPEKITDDRYAIQYLLLDWSRALAARDRDYPASAVPERVLNLWTLQETEQWLKNKLSLLKQYQGAPEEELPLCEDEDLWRTDPKYKYYADENTPSTKRSTKNFDTLVEAMTHKAEKNKGRVDIVPGEVKACAFCSGRPICSQAAMLEASGQLRPREEYGQFQLPPPSPSDRADQPGAQPENAEF